jgi:hypothetical protein
VERTVHDYGVDLMLFTYSEEGEVENGAVRVQLKATDQLSMLQDGQTIALTTHRADLEYWLGKHFPVILVLYDAVNDVAYWIYVQAYFARRTSVDLAFIGETMTIHIPTSQMVDTGAMRLFAGCKANIIDQLRGVRHGEA